MMADFKRTLIKTLRQKANISIFLSKEHFTEWDKEQDFLILSNANYKMDYQTLSRPKFEKLDKPNDLIFNDYGVKTFNVFNQVARALRKTNYMKVKDNKLILYYNDFTGLNFTFDLDKIQG